MGSMHDNWTWSLSCTGHSWCTARMSHAPACIHVVNGPISHRSGISKLWGHWFAILGCALQWLAGGCLAPRHAGPFHTVAPRHTGLELEPWGSFALDSGCALQWSAGGRPRPFGDYFASKSGAHASVMVQFQDALSCWAWAL